MSRYYFHLRADGLIHRDFDGVELPNVQAARVHASAVAEELMRGASARTRLWSIAVEGADRERVLDLFFADVDLSVQAYSPPHRALATETCRRLGALADARAAVRTTVMESRILLARARGKPQLVSSQGE